LVKTMTETPQQAGSQVLGIDRGDWCHINDTACIVVSCVVKITSESSIPQIILIVGETNWSIALSKVNMLLPI